MVNLPRYFPTFAIKKAFYERRARTILENGSRDEHKDLLARIET